MGDLSYGEWQIFLAVEDLLVSALDKDCDWISSTVYSEDWTDCGGHSSTHVFTSQRVPVTVATHWFERTEGCFTIERVGGASAVLKRVETLANWVFTLLGGHCEECSSWIGGLRARWGHLILFLV